MTVGGGVVRILTGAGVAAAITALASWHTDVSASAIPVAFVVSRP
jgi:hypothetical protein